MPKNKKEEVIFTIMMVLCMVYTMICYNIACGMGSLKNIVFVKAFYELPIMGVIAFLLELFVIGRITKSIAFKIIDPKKTQPLFITLVISSLTVCFMCPTMSFIASVLFNFNGLENMIVTWLTITARNFPMAFFVQIFYIGPLVRFIFRKLFN